MNEYHSRIVPSLDPIVTIRRGLTRTVILTRRWAVKLPQLAAHGDGVAGVLWSLARGISANLSERQWSNSPGVCPVTYSLAGLVNLYRRCAPVDHEPSDAEYSATGYDQSWNDRPPATTLLRTTPAQFDDKTWTELRQP